MPRLSARCVAFSAIRRLRVGAVAATVRGMRTICRTLITITLALCATEWSRAEDINSVDGPNVRVKRHDDKSGNPGGKDVYTKSPDGKVVTKKTYTAAGRLMLTTVYRTRDNGDLAGSKIYDGRGTELYKVSYGYEKKYGQLVREEMYDSRVRRVWKNNPSKEMPVQVVEYLVDAEGKVSGKPVIRNYMEGNTFERDYGQSTSAMDPKMFDQPAAGTPGNQPAGQPPAGGR